MQDCRVESPAIIPMALRRIDEWHANGSGEEQNYAVKEEKEVKEKERETSPRIVATNLIKP